MGRRKKRFAPGKNFERKRRKLELRVSIPLEYIQPPPLVVSLPVSSYKSAVVEDVVHLRSRLETSGFLPFGWAFSDGQPDASLSQPLTLHKLPDFGVAAGVVYELQVTHDLVWKLRFGESIVEPSIELLKDCVLHIGCVDHILQLLSLLDEAICCVGNSDSKFLELIDRHKGSIKDPSGTRVVASLDSRSLPAPTVRHSQCEFIVSRDSPQCTSCADYRHTLRTMSSRQVSSVVQAKRVAISSHTNYRYLSTPEKHQRMKSLHHENRLARLRLERLRAKLEEAIESKGVSMDDDITDDLHKVMEEEEKKAMDGVEQGSFRQLFWSQQKEAAGKRDKRGMRWHPAMIKWCLFLRHQSRSAYSTLRDSGCLFLPSERSLRDYSQAVKSEIGFSAAVDSQLLSAANITSCEEWEKLVILIIDEMYIREDLIFQKSTGRLVGYISLGNVNDHLVAFERSLNEEEASEDVDEVAKTMMVFMVRGLFTRLRFPYAQFACQSVSGELLFHPFWQAVYRLERMCFKVLGATCDGASVNRRLIKIHDLKAKLTFKVPNPYANDRDIVFFSDPPHLIKTTRNCWSSKARSLWNNGYDISWTHLMSLYEKDGGKGSGISMVPKLSYEHVHLTSFSKMRVDLATQVLSESVSKALPLVVGDVAKETSFFAGIFDKFFDALNVSNFSNGTRLRKQFSHPYRTGDDERLKWLEKTFLPYLDDWEKCVKERTGFSSEEKRRMLLSSETILGLRMTANSFIHLVKFVFSLPEVKDKKLSFLSQNICQDPLENFFGCQRQRGGTSDNPNVQEFLTNTGALRVVNSFCRGPATGNCRGPGRSSSQKDRLLTQDDIAPLPRRKRTATL